VVGNAKKNLRRSFRGNQLRASRSFGETMAPLNNEPSLASALHRKGRVDCGSFKTRADAIGQPRICALGQNKRTAPDPRGPRFGVTNLRRARTAWRAFLMPQALLSSVAVAVPTPVSPKFALARIQRHDRKATCFLRRQPVSFPPQARRTVGHHAPLPLHCAQRFFVPRAGLRPKRSDRSRTDENLPPRQPGRTTSEFQRSLRHAAPDRSARSSSVRRLCTAPKLCKIRHFGALTRRAQH